MRSRILTIAMLLGTIALTAAWVPWADREFQRAETSTDAHAVSRPPWVWAIQRPYRRLQHAWTMLCLAVTVGSGVIVLDPKTWRRPVDPATIIVIVALVASGLTAANAMMASTWMRNPNGFSYVLGNLLEYRMPGAILGAWFVTLGRKVGWRGQLIAGMWMAGVAMTIAYGVIFG